MYSKEELLGLTDWYSITEAYAHWKNGTYKQQGVFNFHYRKSPFLSNYILSCGIATVMEFINAYDRLYNKIGYWTHICKKYGCYDKGFVKYLANTKFGRDLKITAINEGQLVFPYEPLVIVKGDISKCRLLEDLIISTINFESAVATKAFLISLVTNKPFVEFGMRRSKGLLSSVQASRAALIGGASGTSNILVAELYNRPLTGTMSHSYVQSYTDELSAFMSWGKVYHNSIYLVDTYNIHIGIYNAIEAGKKYGLAGIRIDSGDVAYWSRHARQALDFAGFTSAKIVASGDIDEEGIMELDKHGAMIDLYGIGTKMVDPIRIGGVYKLSSIDGRPTCKISQGEKHSYPGDLISVACYQKDKPFLTVLKESNGEISCNQRQRSQHYNTKQDKFYIAVSTAENSRKIVNLLRERGQLIIPHELVIDPKVIANFDYTVAAHKGE